MLNILRQKYIILFRLDKNKHIFATLFLLRLILYNEIFKCHTNVYRGFKPFSPR